MVVRFDLQVQTMPKYLWKIISYQRSLQTVENIWKTTLKMIENQMILIISWWRSLTYRDEQIDFHGRLIDWFPVGWGTPSWRSCGFLKYQLVFYFISYLLFRNCYKLFHVDSCWTSVPFRYSLRTSESFLTPSGCNRGGIG